MKSNFSRNVNFHANIQSLHRLLKRIESSINLKKNAKR